MSDIHRVASESIVSKVHIREEMPSIQCCIDGAVQMMQNNSHQVSSSKWKRGPANKNMHETLQLFLNYFMIRSRLRMKAWSSKLYVKTNFVKYSGTGLSRDNYGVFPAVTGSTILGGGGGGAVRGSSGTDWQSVNNTTELKTNAVT